MIVKTEAIELNEFYVAGISVRTINQNGQAGKDIKALWGRFVTENVFGSLEDKVSGDIYCVYTEYETDYTDYYTAVLGCKVKSLTQIPDGFTGVTIAGGTYIVYSLEGKCPQNVLNAWQDVWNSDVERKYTTDFDVYTPNVKSFEDSEVKIFLAIK